MTTIQVYGKWRLTDERVLSEHKCVCPVPTAEKASTEEYTGRVFTLTQVYSEARKYSGVVYPLDNTYYEPKLEALQKFLNTNGISEEPYVPDEHDCENYSLETWVAIQRYFKHVPFGNVSLLNNNTGGGHMLNCCFVEGKWYWYEPQTNMFMTNLGNNITVRYIQI